MISLIVYNPLPAAYAHRERQLSATLGGGIRFVRTENERLGGRARLAALFRHIRAARRLRRANIPVLVTWPLLGWLEVVLWASSTSRVYLSVHDPRPLRRQIGLGRGAAWLARRVPPRRRPAIVAHSSVALDAIRETLPGSAVTLLPLPMLPQTRPARAGEQLRRVAVLGQYKPARDLEILTQLGARLHDAGFTGVIAGRGWPPVDGWEVRDQFLTEAEFDAELKGAGCLLVPYRHYFQSGVAARAVELGTPVVGADHPFLRESLGLADSPGIVRDPASAEAWMAAITASIEATGSPLDVFDKVSASWRDWQSQIESHAVRRSST